MKGEDRQEGTERSHHFLHQAAEVNPSPLGYKWLLLAPAQAVKTIFLRTRGSTGGAKSCSVFQMSRELFLT